MDKAAVDRWLLDYVEAWKSNARSDIEALFAEDIEYRYHPYDPPLSGRTAVVDSWLGEGDNDDASVPDPPGTFDATYSCVAVEEDVAVAIGTSTYFADPGGPVDRVYDNCYVMRFDDEGRCREFTEWYMKRPSE